MEESIFIGVIVQILLLSVPVVCDDGTCGNVQPAAVVCLCISVIGPVAQGDLLRLHRSHAVARRARAINPPR